MPATREICITNGRPGALRAFHDTLDRFWVAVDSAHVQPVPLPIRMAMTTAVAEVAANILRYARSDVVQLALSLEGGLIEARFRDRGIPLKPSTSPPPGADELPEGGRGLLLARRSLDVLDYDRTKDGVNCWRLAIQLPVPS